MSKKVFALVSGVVGAVQTAAERNSYQLLHRGGWHSYHRNLYDVRQAGGGVTPGGG